MSWERGDADSLLRVARLASQLLVEGGGAAKEGLLAGLQVDGDGDVVGVVHRPALDQLQAGLHCHAGRLEVKVWVPKRLESCTSWWDPQDCAPHESRGRFSGAAVMYDTYGARGPQRLTPLFILFDMNRVVWAFAVWQSSDLCFMNPRVWI